MAVKIDNISLFDFSQTLAKTLFETYRYPWEIIPMIGEFIINSGNSLPKDQYKHHSPDIWIAYDAKISDASAIYGPAIICPRAELRPGAYIRGNVLIGEGSVVGNSTELKNCILFNHVAVPHFNYVGDSILGYHSHMGAGAIASNVKVDKTLVVIHGDEDIQTGLKKMGAILGDGVEIGCHCVLNPGTIVGKNTSIYPLTSVRGVIPENSIVKRIDDIICRQ
jgi:UDP-N-acetylglucosamine diphosphorylase / glucose-1-phosphate thymidylyltransferase / UDP-N-acetylgalactosamine diphosphorylase / glucosamine-1-phosphate N-acetyltransferase / galactosamine-1-phosphate N-acetyltransferase